MIKRIYHFILSVVMLAGVVGFNACSDDDDKGSGGGSYDGAWVAEEGEGLYISNGLVYVGAEVDGVFYYDASEENGTIKNGKMYIDGLPVNISVSGDILTVSGDKAGETMTFHRFKGTVKAMGDKSDGEIPNSNNQIVGQWYASAIEFVFNADGTGSMTTKNGTDRLVYTLNDGMLDISFEDGSGVLFEAKRNGTILYLTDTEDGYVFKFTNNSKDGISGGGNGNNNGGNEGGNTSATSYNGAWYAPGDGDYYVGFYIENGNIYLGSGSDEGIFYYDSKNPEGYVSNGKFVFEEGSVLATINGDRLTISGMGESETYYRHKGSVEPMKN